MMARAGLGKVLTTEGTESRRWMGRTLRDELWVMGGAAGREGRMILEQRGEDGGGECTVYGKRCAGCSAVRILWLFFYVGIVSFTLRLVQKIYT